MPPTKSQTWRHHEDQEPSSSYGIVLTPIDHALVSSPPPSTQQAPPNSLKSLVDIVPTEHAEDFREDFSAPTAKKTYEAAAAVALKHSRPQEEQAFGFLDLYRYATLFDWLMLAGGLVATCANGVFYPCMALLFGETIQSFQPLNQSKINEMAWYYLLIATALFVTDYVSYVLFFLTAERQIKHLRHQAFRHMLYLDVSWYDANDAWQLSNRLSGDTVKIKEGMGQKLGDAIRFTCQFVSGYVIGFVKGWDMTLMMACVMPLIVVSMGLLIKTLRKQTEWAQKVYAEAGAVAEETFGAIRTVVSLNGEHKAMAKYNTKTENAEQANVKLARMTSIVMGVVYCGLWLMYGVGLWYGGAKVSHDQANPGTVFQAFFGIIMGSFSVAQISPNLSAVSEAKGAAAALYKILATDSQVDASKDFGVVPQECRGEIQVVGVNFTYPTRSEAPILNDYNVRIESGQTVAFVGASGGGKSTLIALLERFYDPQSGTILLDGRDIKTLQVKWLRSQIGLVSQEPVLFATTIFKNIAAAGENVTREEVIEAAKLANAHTFIMSLPQQYDTMVGEKGVSLSGGQKQRVAIARAIVRKPKILVLDEATSALDSESERVVQAALNDLMDKTNMTTLVIAHRLSTVRRADKIVVLSSGHVVEEGNHEELMKKEKGLYRNLYNLQEIPGAEEEEEATTFDVGSYTPTTMGVTRQDSQVSITSHCSSHQRAAASTPPGSCEHSKTQKQPKSWLKRLMSLSAPERKFFLVGCLCAAVVGMSQPISSILLTGMMTSMTQKYMDYHHSYDHHFLDDLRHEVMVYGLSYLGGALVLLAAHATMTYCFKIMAEKLTTRLRNMNFTALVRQNIGFFDEPTHATGALTAELATNATKVSLVSGDSQGRVVSVVFTFIAALMISFSLGSWILTLVMLAVLPLLVAGQVIRTRRLKGLQLSDELGEAGACASQALSNIRTVVSLGLEESVTEEYSALLLKPLEHGSREAHANGIALGFSTFIMFAVYALCFWYGGKLVHEERTTFQEVMRTLMAIMMSSQGIGQAASWLADSDNAKEAACEIFDVVDRSLPIDSFETNGIIPSRVDGRLEFKGIVFRYPTRAEVTVLHNYNLVIEAGQTVAFCGPSGGGKSTVIGMIERFYDPVRGQVLLDGVDIKELNLRWLRAQIGLVGQEPTLFIGTIADNIGYGLSTQPTQEQIEQAARMANAHDFISAFPDGYETQVGMKGEQLSGGQKQRIAIARAILKNPNILLLDEATSALDSESEHIVQEALDKVVALKKRTTIIIAHRLSTIQKADKICVVSGKRVAEQGTHAELMALNGIYSRLVNRTKE